MLRVVFVLLLFSVYSSLLAQTSTLKLIITNLDNNEGILNVAIYNEENKVFFPKNPDSAFIKKNIEIRNQKGLVVFSNIPYGTYAVSVFHDENNNGKIDRTFIGFPSEAFGISGNKFVFGPPKFDDGKFHLNSKERLILIKMKNFF